MLKELQERATTGDALDALVLITQAQEELDRLRIGTVGRARGEGLSWVEIGTALGTSKQAALQRFGRLVLR